MKIADRRSSKVFSSNLERPFMVDRQGISIRDEGPIQSENSWTVRQGGGAVRSMSPSRLLIRAAGFPFLMLFILGAIFAIPINADAEDPFDAIGEKIREDDPCTDLGFAAKAQNKKECKDRQDKITRYNEEEAERERKIREKYGDKSAPGPCDKGYTLRNPETVPLMYPDTSPGGKREALDSQQKPIPVNVLTEDEAKTLMIRLKDLKEKRVLGNKNNRHIGCAQRAHLTACHMQRECKLSSAKVFVEPSGLFNSSISMQRENQDNEYFDWTFHVGNLFYVKDAEGNRSLHVIDYFQDTEKMIAYDKWMESLKKGRKENGNYIPNKIQDLFTANATYHRAKDVENRVGRECRDIEAQSDLEQLWYHNRIIEREGSTVR
jgi:hypothetical protein